MSTVLTTVLPAYTIADPVTSTMATVVEQAFKNKEIKMIDTSLFIVLPEFGVLPVCVFLLFLFRDLFADLVQCFLLLEDIQWIVYLLQGDQSGAHVHLDPVGGILLIVGIEPRF